MLCLIKRYARWARGHVRSSLGPANAGPFLFLFPDAGGWSRFALDPDALFSLFPSWAADRNSCERDVRILETEVVMYSNSILLIQSRTDSSSQLRTRLEDKGYTVVEARDPAAAMDIVNCSKIGLVVTELYVPIGKSRCLARVIANSPTLRSTKLLAYTSHGKKQDRDWARSIGADGYVITRSGEDRFLSVVDHLMEAPSTPRRAVGRPHRAS